MTNNEILDYMKVRYDIVTSQGAPGYEDDDYNNFFNSYQKIFFKMLYNEFGNMSGIGAEETEKRSKDLVALKDHEVVTVSATGDHPNSFFCDLDEKFVVALKEECTVSYVNDCGDTVEIRIPVKPVKEDYYNANVRNSYKRPYEELVWRLDRERGDITQPLSATNRKRHEIVLFDGATLVDYRVTYYRRPKDVDLTDNNDFCEFDPIHHQRIADGAVELMMQTTGRPDLQTKMIENTKVPE